ncbi:uncharacterized protein LOC106998109 [Macaca mulatta]
MGAALGPPPPHREGPTLGYSRRGRVRRAAPGPCVPSTSRAAWTARRPRKEAACSVPAPTTHAAPSGPLDPEPILTAARGPAGHCARDPHPARLGEARGPPQAHSAAGRRGRPWPAEGVQESAPLFPAGGPAGARLTLLLGSMAALCWWLWLRRVRGWRRACERRSPAQACALVWGLRLRL